MSIANKIIFSLLLFLVLNGCSGEKCIDPDDFGFPSFTISARYKPEELEGDNLNQVAFWRDYGLKANGRPITIVVKNWQLNASKSNNNVAELSAWSSWFGSDQNTNILAPIVERMQACEFGNSGMCPGDGSQAVILNAPCLFTKGVGLYALLAAPGTDPNSSRESKTVPNGIAFHVGEPQSGYKLYSTNSDGTLAQSGGIVFNYENVPNASSSTNLKTQYLTSPLYFKIIDKYYGDNSGQYKVVVKSGVDSARQDPITYLTDTVKSVLFGDSNAPGVIKTIFISITNQTAYQVIVRGMLILYIIFSAFNFLIGSIQITNAELITRVLKVIIISILLTTDRSWNFFNNYLFVYFIGGVDYITQIISNAASGGGWGKLPLLQIMIAPQTFSKLFAILFMSYTGWLFVIIYFCLLFFVLLITVKATIIYLTALIIIGLLIVLAPIFLTFYLFDITRSLFDNWIRQLISYSLQPILLFAGMGLLTILILQQIYTTLGFRVCKQEIFNFGPITSILGNFSEEFDMGSNSTSLLYFWFPYPRDLSLLNTQTEVIPVPYDHFNANGDFCQAYECNEPRIPELPFLDPNNPADQDRINSFKSGNVVDFKNLFIFIISIYLLNKFNEITLNISQFLSDTSGNTTDLGQAAQRSYAPIANYAQNLIKSRVLNPAWRIIRNSRVGLVFKEKQELAKQKFTSFLEGQYEREFESKYLMPSQVRELAENNSGFKYDNLNMKDYKLYKNSLQELLSSKGFGKLSATQLFNMSPQEIQNELAKRKFNKDFTDLNKNELEQLKKLISNTEEKLGKSLREFKMSLKDVEAFKRAYIEAHMELTSKGVGFFSKRSKIITGMVELKSKYDKFSNRKETALLKRVEEDTEGYYKIYNDLLNQVSNGKLGNDFNYYNYDSNRMLTHGEQYVERELKQGFEEIDKKINHQTLKTGRDIVDPIYHAEIELTSNKKNINNYEQLVKQKISKQVYEAMTYNGGDSPILMGRRYMGERMSDEEFQAAIDNTYSLKDDIIKKDDYLSGRKNFEDNLKQREQEFRESVTKIDDQKFAQELVSKFDENNLPLEQIDSMLSDKKYDTLRTTIKDYQFNKTVIEKMNLRQQMIEDEIGGYVNEMNNFRRKNNMTEYKPYIKK